MLSLKLIFAAAALLAASAPYAQTVTVKAACPNGEHVTWTKTDDRNAITVDGTSFSRSGGTGKYITRNGETAVVQYAGDGEGYQVAVATTPRELERGSIALIGWNAEPQECTITSTEGN